MIILLTIKESTGQQYEVLGWRWYAANDTTGVVAIKSQPGVRKAYIGPAKFGIDEKQDVEYLCAHGAKLEQSVAEAFFPAIAADKEYRYGI